MRLWWKPISMRFANSILIKGLINFIDFARNLVLFIQP